MKLRRKDNKIVTIVVLLLILVIGIGYAALSTNLNITGATAVAGNTWDIHFDNVQISSGSVDATTPATINPSDNTEINYAVELSKPGDFYEFTVDMVNAGTLPGKVTLVELSGITSEVEEVIDYSIVYTDKNTPVAVNDILNGESSKNIKVRVIYNDDIDEDDLLATDVNLTLVLNITFNQSDEEESPFSPFVQELIDENPSCMTKYEGQVTDQVGQTVTAQNVYFNKCADKRNIIFNNMCWQMIRTTETGGIKIIYNGEPIDGKCESNRGKHKGISSMGGDLESLNGEYLYGNSFTYNTTTNEYSLVDTTPATWSASTYESLIGKYTCKTTGNTCTTIYQINGYKSNTQGYASAYTIGDTNYALIGISPYNAYNLSLSMGGYMFNKTYNYKIGDPTSGSLMGNDVSYSNGTYTLLPASGESTLGTTKDNTHHYTCNNTTGTCNKVRFYFNYDWYIELDGEANIDEVLDNMLYGDNVNRYNSSVKGIIDAWYRQNMLSKTDVLEDTIFCNARNLDEDEENGWNKDGNINTDLYFKNAYVNGDLTCLNITDQFAVSNNKAKLKYPVGLISSEEMYNIGTKSLRNTGFSYWTPSCFKFDAITTVRYISYDGGFSANNVSNSLGSRPAVSLKSGVQITSGTGSETDPWIVE